MEGNCIDKFLEKRVNPSLDNLINLKSLINNRIEERFNTNDYFNTGCYENDFSDIRKLRDEAYKLTKECNKFLERISEQYSKFN